MKKFIEKITFKFNYWFAWLCSKKVLNAINDGLTYDEVDAIARQEATKRS
jgi:hypothetical protein